jgi:hypothetical protein
MGLMNFQLGAADESTYGTAVTPARFFEYESEDISESYGRTESDPLRTGSGIIRSDRFTPYFAGAAGTVQMSVMTKGFAYWFKHMLGGVATTGPVETSVYTHTATEGAIETKSFTLQVNRPFNPSGTDQAFTYRGGKITEWTLSNSVDGNLLLDLGMDFQQVSTATALATATYPTNMDNLTWVGGVVTIGGTPLDVTEFSVKWSNGLNVDSRQIRGNADKKEPQRGPCELTFDLSAQFDTLANRNRAAATSRAGALAAIVATWTGPTLLGTTIFPQLQVTLPAARFDEWSGAVEGREAITQSLSGVGRWDGTSSPVSIVYKSADVTP